MNKLIVVIGLILSSFCVFAKITINGIHGPEYVEDGTVNELILDCDFSVEDETGVVVKWFLNSENIQIYQWITDQNASSAMGPMTENIDATYQATNDSKTFLRALRFKTIDPDISGNYTCKVTGDDSEAFLTKPLMVYSPPTSFQLTLIDSSDEEDIVFCDADMVTPLPIFNVHLDGFNQTDELPEGLTIHRQIKEDDQGYYNLSIMVKYNSSYLEEGTTRFVCTISIPGTNYSETKFVDHFIAAHIDEYLSITSESTNIETFTEEVRYVRDNGFLRLSPSLATVLILIFPLVLAT